MESKIPSFFTHSGLSLLSMGTLSNEPGSDRTSLLTRISWGAGLAGVGEGDEVCACTNGAGFLSKNNPPLAIAIATIKAIRLSLLFLGII